MIYRLDELFVGNNCARSFRWLTALAEHSETARRLTNLFSDPKPVEHVGAFLEEGLIHRTTRGELVRSKSKVIITKPELSSTSTDRRL